MKNKIAYVVIFAMCLTISACGGSSNGGGSVDQKEAVTAPEDVPFSSGTCCEGPTLPEDTLFGAIIEFNGYLPDELERVAITLDVDADNSGTENLGDFTVSFSKFDECSGNICRERRVALIEYFNIGRDERPTAVGYWFDNTQGKSFFVLAITEIFVGNTVNALKEGNVAVNLTVIEYAKNFKDFDSVDYLPEEDIYVQLNADIISDEANDYRGSSPSSDIVTLQVFNSYTE